MLIFEEKGHNLAEAGKRLKRGSVVFGVELSYDIEEDDNGTINVETVSEVAWIGEDLEAAETAIAYEDDIFTNIWDQTIDNSKVGALTKTITPFAVLGAGNIADKIPILAKFQEKLFEAVHAKDISGMKFALVEAYPYAGEAGAYRAVRYAESTWKPQNYGGSGSDGILAFPIMLTYAGEMTVGTVDKVPVASVTGEVSSLTGTFTPRAVAP
jgi:hypothetical protein